MELQFKFNIVTIISTIRQLVEDQCIISYILLLKYTLIPIPDKN